MSIGIFRLSASLSVLMVAILFLGVTAATAHAVPTTSAGSASPSPLTITLKTVTVGKGPEATIYDTANKEVYVGNTLSNTVSAVNSTTYKVTTIPVGKDPIVLTYSASSKDVYVLNEQSNNVSVISSANKVLHTIKLPGLAAFNQVYDPANGDVYVVSFTTTTSEVSDVNHNTWALTNLLVPAGAQFATYDNASASLVVASSSSNELTAINATDKTTTVKLTVGLTPVWAVYNPSDKDLYISDLGATAHGYTKTGNVSVLSSANKIIKTLKVGSVPTFGTYDPSNHDVYVVNTGNRSGSTYQNSTVSVIGTGNTIVKTIAVGKDAAIAVYDPKNSEMYVSAADSNKTYAINSSTNVVAATIKTTQYAGGCLYDPALGDMLAGGESTFVNSTSTAKTIVTVIPPSNTGTSTLTLGTGPLGGAVYDPTDLGVWAVNHGTTTVTIIL